MSKEMRVYIDMFRNKLINENKEMNLSKQEEKILNDILSEFKNLHESDFNNIIKKIKNYAAKGLLTTGIVAALLATPNITQAQSDAIKNVINNTEKTEQTQPKITIEEFINLLNTNYKDIYEKLKSEDENLINMIKSVFINDKSNKINWDNDEKFQDWIFNFFLNQGKAIITSGDSKASNDLKRGITLKNMEHYNDIVRRNQGITKVIAYNYQSNEDQMIRYIQSKVQKIYWDEEDKLKK